MLKHFFHQIRIKMLVMMVALLVVVSLLLAITLYRESSRVMESTYQSISRNSLIVCGDVLDLRLKYVIELVRGNVFSESFSRNFVCSQDGYALFPSESTAVVRLNDTLGQLLLLEPQINGTYFFEMTHNRMVASSSNRSQNLFRYYTQPLDTSADWYQYTLSANGKEVFFGYNVLNNTDNQSFSMVKLVRSTDSFQGIGLLVVTIDINMIYDLVQHWHADEESAMMIVDETKQDHVIFCSQPEEQDMLHHYLLQRDENQNGEYLFQAHRASLSQWSFISFIHKDHLSASGQYIRSYMLIVLISILLLGVMISLVTTYYLYRPIEHLRETLQQFRQDHLPITSEFDESEIGEIGSCIKNAVNESLELSQRVREAEVREKESELRLLQAQINPHFLYNTLDSLYMMAVMHNVDEIAEMTAALSDIFKITLSKGNRYIQLENELAYIEQYMLIQNIRFSNRFHLSIEADDEARQCFMLKLLIQPFIENAISHGLEPKLRDGHIHLCAHVEDGYLFISVVDDGLGVEDVSTLDKGYGIRNVRKRIQLFYGTEGSIQFHSKPGEGVVVLLQIPIWPEEKYKNIDV